jgi:4-amino-4-deoxy-L-arabinose transferase-like glycosyltransferase
LQIPVILRLFLDRQRCAGESPASTRSRAKAERRGVRLPAQFLFFYILVLALHAPLLSLPYFWDEAGYFIPAARDLLLTGDPIPTTTLSNAHPPLVMTWLALWWKVFGTAFWVTRTAMLVFAALALAAVFRLGERLGGRELGVAAAACTAVYPVFFAQSSLAHLDMAAAAFTLWGVLLYQEGRRAACVGLFALAALAKETAIVAPLALFAWELVASRKWPRVVIGGAKSLKSSAALLLTALPLAVWFAYHYARTEYAFGNPEFVDYNLLATLHPARIGLAALRRLWQLFGYMNLFVLTVVAACAWWMRRREGSRDAVPRAELATFAAIGTSYVVMHSVLGGAVLARYLLPVVPLVIVGSLWTVQQAIPRWKLALAVILLSFSIALFAPSVTASPPEDSLAYRNFIAVQARAAAFLEQEMPNAMVLTVWPATDELQRPWLGYVTAPVSAVQMKNFSDEELARAPSGFDAVLVYSHHPENRLLRYFPSLERAAERWFEGHRDLNAEEVAATVGGRIVFRAENGQQWAAVVVIATQFPSP